MMRRQEDEAEGMERLSAEYSPWPAAQAERWDTLLTGAGFTEAELQSVRSSDQLGQLTASLRRAEARRLDIDTALPKLVGGRAFDGAGDVPRPSRRGWTAGPWRSGADGEAPTITSRDSFPGHEASPDPDMASALTERDQAMHARARAVAIQAIESGQPWAKALGAIPEDPARRVRWVRDISTLAAYLDRWHVAGNETIDSPRRAPSLTARARPAAPTARRLWTACSLLR